MLETYGEGDLTAYIFETKHDRDDAARAWQETGGEYAARVLEDDHGYATSAAESLGEAVAACWADRSGRGRDAADQITRDDVADALEKYEGAYATEAEWAEARFEDYAEGVREALEGTSLPDEVIGRMLSVDWQGVAFDMGANGSGVTIYSGHAFRDN